MDYAPHCCTQSEEKDLIPIFTIVISAMCLAATVWVIMNAVTTKPTKSRKRSTSVNGGKIVSAKERDEAVVKDAKNPYEDHFREWEIKYDRGARLDPGDPPFDEEVLARSGNRFVSLHIRRPYSRTEEEVVPLISVHLWTDDRYSAPEPLAKVSKHSTSRHSIAENLAGVERDRIGAALHKEIMRRQAVRAKREDRKKLLLVIKKQALERESADEAIALITGGKNV